MERFTWKAPDGTYQIDDRIAVHRTTCYDENFKNAFDIYEGKAIDKLGAYEDAEEQGLLLRLPVAEGTEVFAIMESYFYEEFGYGVEPWYSICGENFDRNMIEYFGKTVFLTREEAETALEKMKGE